MTDLPPGSGNAARRALLASALVLPLLLVPHRSRAQAPDGADTTVVALQDLVVSVTRTEQVVGQLPVKVRIVSADEIEASPAQTVPDLLRTMPGITLRDYQSSIATHPTRQAPSMRGLGGGTSAGRTVVLLDGMPVADPWGGWVHWARIPMEAVARIEIVRGGAAGIWGSRALGGVINIVTREASRTGGELSLEGGALSTARGTGTVTLRGESVDLLASARYSHTDGFVGVSESLRGAIDEPAGGEHRRGFARMRARVSPSVTVGLTGGYLNEHRDWGTPLRDTDLEAGFVRASADVRDSDSGHWSFDLFADRQGFQSTFSSESLDRSAEQPSLEQFDVPATSAGAQARWSRQLGTGHELTAGADLYWVDGEVNERYLWFDDSFHRRRHISGRQLLAGVYAQDVFRPGPGWRILGSLRWDLASSRDGSRVVRNLDSGALEADSAFDATTESSVNFSLGVSRDLGERVSVRGNVFRAYRAPTLNELYKPFREPGNVVTESNAALEAEQAFGGELGADFLLTGSTILRVTGFWTRVESPIVEATLEEAGDESRFIAPCGFVPGGGVCRQRRNLGALRAAGVEAELELRPHRAWTLRGSYLWNPTEVTSAPDHPDLEGKSASRTPEHAVTASVRWSDPRILDVRVLGRYVGRRFEDDLNALALDDFFLLDVRLARTIADRWDAFLSAENLLDTEYVTARPSSGLVRVGAPRILLGGVRVRW